MSRRLETAALCLCSPSLSFWQRCKGEKLLSTGHKTHLAAQLTKSDSSPSSSSSPDSTDSCSSSDSPSSICSHHVPENRRSQSGRVSQNRASPTILLSPTPIRASPQPPACRCTNRAQAPRLHLNVLQSCQGKPMGMVEGGRKKKFYSRIKFSNQISTSLIIPNQPHVCIMYQNLGKKSS